MATATAFRASRVAVFASQPNRMEVDRSAASGISSVSLRRTINALKNTERGYSGLAPVLAHEVLELKYTQVSNMS